MQNIEKKLKKLKSLSKKVKKLQALLEEEKKINNQLRLNTNEELKRRVDWAIDNLLQDKVNYLGRAIEGPTIRVCITAPGDYEMVVDRVKLLFGCSDFFRFRAIR